MSGTTTSERCLIRLSRLATSLTEKKLFMHETLQSTKVLIICFTHNKLNLIQIYITVHHGIIATIAAAKSK